MEDSADLKTQAAVAKRSGIAQTGVSQMLRPDNDAMKSPKLTQVEKVAGAFGLAAWQILVDEPMTDFLMRPTVSDERLEGFKAPSPTPKASKKPVSSR